MSKRMAVLLAMVAAGACTQASAGLYRCGNAFQDRPCDAGVEQQLIRPGRGAGSSPAALAASAAAKPASAAAKPASAAPEAAVARPAASAQAAASGAAAQAVPVATPVAARPATGATAACANLREQRNALDGRLRIGGSPATADMLQRQRRETDRNMAEAGC